MLFGAVAVAVAIAGIEAGSWLLLRLAAVPELEPRLRQLLSDPDAVRPLRALRHQEPEGLREEAIHPYLGFVTVPPSQVRDGPLTLEALGLPGGGPLVREARPDTLVLGVFGGSLAQYFAIGDGPQRLFTGLQSLPEFAGAPLEYENTGLFPLYPSRWVLRVANLDADTKMRLLIGEIAYRKEERARWADRLLHSRALPRKSPIRRAGLAAIAWSGFGINRHTAKSRLVLDQRSEVTNAGIISGHLRPPQQVGAALPDDVGVPAPVFGLRRRDGRRCVSLEPQEERLTRNRVDRIRPFP
jgi:hypothetical protein